ncbi:MAG: ubiquitin-like small modifier protein 1 [Candidatus Caldarchaeum sp.]|nr:MoaD family protein [Candidatus Caldarchaeum sp.]MCX8200596.1 MoaD family protein [Candidatus Caldarchaeum sp.]MDW8063359.1 ubiquitin-like small modifier protein 1 [Candidatus Caldarchaeum sp.]
MPVKVYLPTPLRQYAEGRDVIELDGSTVGDVLNKLVSRYTNLQKHLFTETGSVRSFVNVFLNNEDIRFLDGVNTKIKDGDTIYIIPSIAGGMSMAQPAVARKIGRTVKQHGRITVPAKLLKRAKKREVAIIIEDVKYLFEPDKYRRIYLPPPLREKITNMNSFEFYLAEGELTLRFRRF